MLNRSAIILEALPGKLDIKRHSPSILYLQGSYRLEKYLNMKGFLEKSLKMKYPLKSTRESL